MPELPEVESARRLVDRECLGKKIHTVVVADDDKVFQGQTPQEFNTNLVNRRVTATCRLGKHMWLEFDNNTDRCLLLHFGMTGGIAIRGRGGAHYQRYSVDANGESWPPRFCKLQIDFEDGTQLAFCDSRRFARVRMISNPLSQPPLSELGWDPLLSMPSKDTFSSALEKQRRAIKAVVLDQSFSAGVGNWVADEVLFQSRIHPEQPANSLSQDQIDALYHQIPHVCQVASDVNAESDRLPEDWLFHHRWTKGNKTKPKILGHTIEHITVGGRTSAYVPALQKLNTSGTGTTGKRAAPQKQKQQKEIIKPAKKQKASVSKQQPRVVAATRSSGRLAIK